MTTSWPCFKVPGEARDHVFAGVALEVSGREGPRGLAHLLEGPTGEEAAEESLLGVVGPRPASDGADREGDSKARRGEVGGA